MAMNWTAIGHLVKAAGYALFQENEDEEREESDQEHDRSHSQRYDNRPRAPKRTKIKKNCCIYK